MRIGREAWSWRSLWWWLAVLAVAVQLKHHYSMATAAELEWMLRPLSQLLEWLSGHEFHRDNRAEWVSETADVRLVKGCAGINFMLMSFMAYAWVARPQRCAGIGLLPWIVRRPPLLFGAFAAAWATGLVANSLRIIVAMNAESQGWKLDAIGIGAAELHRVIGMAVYLPVLSVQMMWADRGTSGGAVAASFLLYLLLMVVVPLITGNAMQQPTLFLEHLLSVSVVMGLTWGICCLLPAVYRRRWHAGATVKTVAGYSNCNCRCSGFTHRRLPQV